MTLRYLFTVLMLALVWSSGAQASSYDGMSIWEIRAHSDFVADDYSLSSATNSGDPDADNVYFRKDEVLLVVVSRFAALDGDNVVRFTDSGNETCAAVYRTSGLLLLASE